jgi:uncharacterized protein (DUF3820 family)
MGLQTDHALTLPFGRHKGKPLGDVPGDYLRWMLKECRLSSGRQCSHQLARMIGNTRRMNP